MRSGFEPGDRCWSCGREVPGAVIEATNVLHARSAEEGGPYRWLPCGGCDVPNGVAGNPELGWILHPVEGRHEPTLAERLAPRFGRRQARRARDWWARHGGSVTALETGSDAPAPKSRERRDGPDAEPPPVDRKAPRAAPPPEPPADDPRTVLGVAADADEREIRRAFRRAVKRCHPDRVAHLDPAFAELAHRKVKELRAAYEALLGRDPGSRPGRT